MQATPDVIGSSFKKFVANMIAGPAAALGWDHQEGDSDLVKQQRGLMIGLQSIFNAEDAELQAEEKRRFDAFVADRNTSLLPDDYKRSVFTIVLANKETGTEE
jgi:puromycin-sensitive aminopeptidase